MNVVRTRLSLVVKIAALLSLCTCVFVMVYGLTWDFDFLVMFQWGQGSIDITDYALAQWAQVTEINFHLGVLTYAYYAHATNESAKCDQLILFELFEDDNTCQTMTQRYLTKPGYQDGDNIALACGQFAVHNSSKMGYLLDTTTTPAEATFTVYPDTACRQTPVLDHQKKVLNRCQDTGLGYSYKFTPVETNLANQVYAIGMDSNGEMEMVLPPGHPFKDSFNCKSITCSDDLTTATLQLYDDTCSVAGASSTVALDQNSAFDASAETSYFDSSGYTSVMCYSTDMSTSGCERERRECVNSYRACMKQNDVDDQFPPLDPNDPLSCDKGIRHQMCVNCYRAGVQAMIVMGLTCAMQVPLVYLIIRRTSNASDGRCVKFLSLVLAVTVIVGTLGVHVAWRDNCFAEMKQDLEASPPQYGWESFTIAISEVHPMAYVSLMAGALALCIFLVNVITPVPEIYQHHWQDPTTFSVEPNSGGHEKVLPSSPRFQVTSDEEVLSSSSQI